MAATRGRLEGRITVPTGGWTTTAPSATIPAGTYYLSSPGSGANSLLAEVQSRWGASSVTASLGESGTGYVTITYTGAITWGSATQLRDLLGFEGDYPSASSHVGTLSARSVWLPDCPYSAPAAVSSTYLGELETDRRTVAHASGLVAAFRGQRRHRLPVEWQHVTAPRVRVSQEDVSTRNRSWERFWRDHVVGQAPWSHPSGPLRFYPDADAGSYYEYRVIAPLMDTGAEPLDPLWPAGPHRVRLSLVRA